MRPRIPLAALTLLLTVSCGGDGGGMFAECGNGTVEGQEECDDGGTVDCDGCSASCTSEIGFVCGDGTLNQACGEQCDDGNTTPGDGCDAGCNLEGCGNGVLDAGEQCDDGGTVDCDGCSASCTSEIGFVCGDGTLNQACGEQCDDGNTTPGDGCDAACQIEQPPLTISGDYAVDIGTTLDTCGFGSGSTSTPMNVEELSATDVTVDIPIGGAGGACNGRNFVRVGDTLTRQQSTLQLIGACTVQVTVTTTLTFFADDTVTGTEINSFSEVGGVCSGFTLPCTVELDVTGARCVGCFNCVAPTSGTSTKGLGPLGSGLRSGLVIMSR